MEEVIRSAVAIDLSTFEFDMFLLSQELENEEDIGEQSPQEQEQKGEEQ